MKASMKVVLAGVAVLAFALPAAAQPAATSAKDEIWALEQAIYAGRASGDMSAYIDHTSPDYLSWPPTSTKPMGPADLKAGAATMRRDSQEKLVMEFMGFSQHGDTAIIYYKTHRTRRVDGTPSDDHFETTHTWLREGGKWQVFGGLARQMDGARNLTPKP